MLNRFFFLTLGLIPFQFLFFFLFHFMPISVYFIYFEIGILFITAGLFLDLYIFKTDLIVEREKYLDFLSSITAKLLILFGLKIILNNNILILIICIIWFINIYFFFKAINLNYKTLLNLIKLIHSVPFKIYNLEFKKISYLLPLYCNLILSAFFFITKVKS